jgi:hypothetical protein
MALLHSVTRRGANITRRGVKALRRVPGIGPTNVRRNSAFWASLAEIQDVAMSQTHVRDATSVKFVRASIKLSAVIAPAQGKYWLSFGTGTRNWLEVNRARAMNPALDVCRAALGIGKPRLAVDLAEQIVDIRPMSRAGWRVLADGYQAMNLREKADQAAWRHAQLSGIDTTEMAESAISFEEVIADLATYGGQAPEEPVPTLFTLLQDLQTRGWGESGRAGIPRELVAASLAVQPAESQAVADGVADIVLRSAMVYGHDPKLDVADLARKTVASRRRAIVPRVSEETARALTTIDTSGLRHYLDGRSICLIANSQRVGQSGAGALIDGYDIVARFNSFKIDPQHTGSKTSIHAAIHMHNFNWSVPVDVRLIFSGSVDAWRNSINKYIDPEAQTYFGDPTLRWPVRGGELLGETDVVDVPTSGFNLMRLVDLLDVSSKIDLIGFDFNASGPYRLDSAMSLPVARAHDYSAERDWVMKNATGVGDLVISLR